MPIRADSPQVSLPPQPESLPAAALWRPEQWRFDLYRMNGDGTQTLLAPDVPVTDPEVTTTLSGTDTIRGSFTPEVPRLVGQIVPWSTAVLVQFSGSILAMCIVDDDPIEGAGLSFTSVGFFGYLSGMPWIGDDYSKVQVDPLDVARDVWAHVQAMRGFDLGVTLDSTTSPTRIGTEKKTTDFTTSSGEDVEFESGPYTLAEWKSDDLASDFTQLAEVGPFDFTEKHTWSGSGSGDIEHRIALGHPSLGRRRHDLRFHIGENVTVLPQISAGEYASQVLVLGSGEGRKKVRSIVPTAATGRLGRFAIVDDVSLDSAKKAQARATKEAAWRGGDPDVAQITVMDHEAAPLASWANGDHIRLTGDDLDWAGDVDLWVRVLSTTYMRDKGRAVLTVARSERTGQ